MTLESRLDDWSRGWRGPLFAALVVLIAGLPGLFAMPPLDRDESRFAQATSQMLETGDYVVIKFQDQPRFKKPVVPGDSLHLDVSLNRRVRSIWKFDARALVEDAVVAEAQLMCTVRKVNEES